MPLTLPLTLINIEMESVITQLMSGTVMRLGLMYFRQSSYAFASSSSRLKTMCEEGGSKKLLLQSLPMESRRRCYSIIRSCTRS